MNWQDKEITEARNAGIKEVIDLLEQWEKDGCSELEDDCAYLAACRGHLWPYAKVLRKKFGIEEK